MLFSRRVIRPGAFSYCLELLQQDKLLDCLNLYQKDKQLRAYIDSTLDQDIESVRIKIRLILSQAEIEPRQAEKRNAYNKALELYEKRLNLIEGFIKPASGDHLYALLLDTWEEKIKLLSKFGYIKKALNEYSNLIETYFREYVRTNLYHNILKNLFSFIKNIFEQNSIHQASTKDEENRQHSRLILPLLNELRAISTLSLTQEISESVSKIINYIQRNLGLAETLKEANAGCLTEKFNKLGN